MENLLMKTKLTCGALLLIGAAAIGARGESFRTDINPALLYGRAFLLAPDLPQADSDYLFTNNWQGQRLPERVGKLLAQYDNEFKLVRQAAHCTVPCDWGIDMSAGPATLLPGLARVKAVSVRTGLRVQWHLQHGQEAEACEELLAAFALARNASRDGTLISILVQIACEWINCSTIAANFGQFSPETLKKLAEGMDVPPARRTVAECLPTEKAMFLDWTRSKILELRQQYQGDDGKVMEGVRQLFGSFGDPQEDQAKVWQRVIDAAGGTSEGMLKLLREREQIYEQTAPMFSLPYDEYQKQMKVVTEDIEKSANPFLKESVSAFMKSRQREFRIQAMLAMVHAAIEYKLHGESGLKSVTDPCGKGPFTFRRFVFEGADRGFELKSEYNEDKNIAVLIFVEKEGAPFQVDGNYAGRAMPKVAPQQ
jgi:hypothetical protein